MNHYLPSFTQRAWPKMEVPPQLQSELVTLMLHNNIRRAEVNTTAINNAGQAGVFSGRDPIEFNSSQPITLFIVQLVIIICFTQGLSSIFKYVRQPRVIAEVIGGIILGPTALGRIPGFTANIFPPASLSYLNLIATIGLVLFLFLVGMEVDVGVVRRDWKAAVFVSAAGLILPFGAGVGIAVAIYREFIDGEAVSFGHFLLFVGVAASITAFPVLCRILTETKLLETKVGQIVLSAGVGNDVVGWILLALTIALVNADSGVSAVYILLCAVGWTIVVLWPMRLGFRWLCRKSGSFEGEHGPTPFVMLVMLTLVFISAFMTDIIGVHPIFGGFLVGIIMPHDHGFATKVTDKLEDLIGLIFLPIASPIYFVLSGLKTDLGLLDDGKAWGYTIAIIVVAFSGKFFGCAGAAWMLKFNKRESLAIGTLMSCKGLVELIVLNVGLAAGILDTTVFSMFVVMAVVLTVVTTPLTLWVYPPKYRTAAIDPRAEKRATAGAAGAVTGSEGFGGASNTTSRFMMVLSRMEHLSTAMFFTQLFATSGSTNQVTPRLGNAPLGTIDEKSKIHEVDSASDNDTSDDHTPVTLAGQIPRQQWNAHRLIELTGRTLSVMQSIESDSHARTDDLLQLYRSFSALRGINVDTGLDVVEQESFAEIVTRRADEAGSQLLVIPWTVPESGATAAVLDERKDLNSSTGGSSSRPNTPRTNTFDHIFSSEKSGLYTYFLRRVFSDCHKNVAVVVDRGFAAVNNVANGNGGQHLLLPFLGGPDDRLALSLCIQLCHQANVSATVIRVDNNPTTSIASPAPAERKRTVSSVSMEESVRAHQTALDANQLTIRATPSRANGMQSSVADQDIWQRYTGETEVAELPSSTRDALSRITFTALSTTQPLQTVIEKANYAIDQNGRASWRPLLVIAGRGRVEYSPASTLSREMAKLLSSQGQLPDVGAEIRKTIGDIATALAVSTSASIMVVQAGSEVAHEAV